MNNRERKITIHIDNLGPVHDSDLELKPFMVFTGASGTGKSYVSLLIHYIYRVFSKKHDIFDFFENIGASFDDHKKIISSDEDFLFEFSLEQFEEWISTSAIKYVGRSIGNFSFEGKVSIKFHGLPDTFKYHYRKETIEVAGEMKYYDTIIMNQRLTIRLPYDSSEWKYLPYSVLFNTYIQSAYNITQDKTFLLPPSRGGLVCLNDEGRAAISKSSAGMYQEFIFDFGQLKSDAPADSDKTETYSSLSEELINGKINIRDNELFYEQEFGEIPIIASAASIKELAPFAIMLQKGLVEQYSIMFEEPETNLHPELQIKAADIAAKLLQKGCRLRVTTHSDYFLRRINDLLRLDILKERMGEEEYNTFCKEHHYTPTLTISEKITGAYFFRKESKFETRIIRQDAEEGVPFDTFKSVLKNQLTDSSYIYDKICEINETAD